jgi:hypothetical protein
MLSRIASLKFNFWIVFIGAFALIGLIKLTSLLPARYYFSFSKLIAGDDSPFMVDTPSVRGRMLCDLMKKYRVDEKQLGSTRVNCTLNADARQIDGSASGDSDKRLLSANEKDAIYDVAIKQDERVRGMVETALKTFAFVRLNDDEVRKIVVDAATPNMAFAELLEEYKKQLEREITDPIEEYYDALIKARLKRNKNGDGNEQERGPEGEASEKPEFDEIKSNEINAILKAHATFLQDTQTIRSARITQIAKSSVDRIANDQSAVPRSIAEFYTTPIDSALQRAMRQSFSANSLDVKTKSEVRQAMHKEITAEGLQDYLISIVIRVLPVIVFGMALGIALGRGEIGSIGLAGAFASFLLCWPLILAWNQLVSHNWQNYRVIFTSFYVAYILSFLLLARMGGLLGVAVRQGFSRSSSSAAADTGASRVGLAEVSLNVGLGVTFNGLVYAGAAWLPSLAE